MILVRRDDQWGFVTAEFVEVGDALFLDGLGKEVVATAERIAGRVRTVALHVPVTNTLLVDGVWAHNDVSFTAQASTSSSSSSSSGSGSSKSSGSSFSSGGTIAPPILTSGGSSSIGVGASNGSSNNTAV